MRNIIIFLFTTITVVLSDCPPGFFQYLEYCYDVLPVPSTWSEALRLCDATGSRLAWISNEDEDTFVRGLLGRIHDSIPTKEVWLGGTDMLVEGMWVWADTMTNMSYTNWIPGEPNNMHGQHCLGMYRDHGFKWDDYACDQALVPLCKKPFDSSIEAPFIGYIADTLVVRSRV